MASRPKIFAKACLHQLKEKDDNKDADEQEQSKGKEGKSDQKDSDVKQGDEGDEDAQQDQLQRSFRNLSGELIDIGLH